MHKRLSLLDQIVYSAILAESIWYFANLHYGKELELTGSLLCFVLHFCVFSIIYQIFLLLWHKWMKAELTFIANTIFSEKPELAQPIPCNTNNLQFEVSVKEYESKKEEELNQQINSQFLFMNHFIGQSLDESQKEVLKANLKAFATDDKPTLQPVTTEKIGNYGIYDILHLCHAIGHHTLRSKTIEDIARFAKVCFPKYCDKWEVTTICRKLTYTDYPNPRIKVIPKSMELPVFDSV